MVSYSVTVLSTRATPIPQSSAMQTSASALHVLADSKTSKIANKLAEKALHFLEILLVLFDFYCLVIIRMIKIYAKIYSLVCFVGFSACHVAQRCLCGFEFNRTPVKSLN